MVGGTGDDDARDAALDPRRSFIVQAPAGSGKTELLIRRYLTLLATVEEPEQVVAITFTRKAAAEMRNRVTAALRGAAAGTVAARPHEAATLRLAHSVLERDAARGWSLPSYPQRMRIETLDALNARLAQRLPVLAAGVAGAGIVEDAGTLYREAARRTVSELAARGPLGAALRVLVGVMDTDVMRLERMLAELLPRREQWLAHFAHDGEAELRAVLEQALGRLVAEELDEAAALLGAARRATLAALLAHAAEHAEPARRALFEAWRAGPAAETMWARERAGAAPSARLDAWRGLVELLLTKRGGWRRRVDKAAGFGPPQAAARDRLLEFLAHVQGDERLRSKLERIRSLPAPRYGTAEWRTLAALRVALVHAAAELRLVFVERQAVDFVELALGAQQALGRVDMPSDLLLALDRRIRHFLVDEFQDTSHAQLRLLELLTAGWQPGDGRTLFLVGDPMQSIYRFRDADMSLFLRVKRFGIGALRCEPLRLVRNFRSAPAVVDWINATFEREFPAEDDIGAGAAKFSPCESGRGPVTGAGVRVHALRTDDGDAELAATIDIVEAERARAPGSRIGVLVQSRTHLAGLHAHLRTRGLAVHAVEIDPLHEHQVVQDLLGLTRALTHPADRIAWLAVLRSPCCGLSWRDLAALCEDDHERTVRELLEDPERRARLGSDARARVEWLRARLAEAFERRALSPFAAWIESTWVALGGPDTLGADDERVYAEQFFAVLGRIARRGDLDDPASLEEAFSKPGTGLPAPDATGVEIMTIHRAKGLEFDTVILLGLGREPRLERRKVLSLLQRVADDGSRDLLMAPLAQDDGDDALRRFVERVEEERDQAERTRLLYVATTRARDRLHLVCRIGTARDAPAAGTLLRRLWSEVGPDFAASGAAPAAGKDFEPRFEPVLRRFADGYASPAASVSSLPPAASSRELRPEFEWAGQPAVQVGTAVHAQLHRMAETGLEAWSARRLRESEPRFARELALLGLDRDELGPAAARVVRALTAVLEDPRGRWILERHDQARSELRLTLRTPHALEHVQLDRTFVADGVRWIIDFKTSSHEGGDREAFLDSEMRRYRPQLERYARAMTAMESRPVRVGLYFPLLQGFRSWTPEG